MRIHFLPVLTTFVLFAIMDAQSLCGPAVADHAEVKQVAGNDAPVLAKETLVSITDFDAQGRVMMIRAKMQFDRLGRRQTNSVFDAREQLIGTERFRYDQKGRLVDRRYLKADTSLKWRWKDFRHTAGGNASRNDIVNRKGRKIGWYVWHYEAGLLVRRDRFNADGSLRFYYADMKRTDQGNHLQWIKFDAVGRRIGTKRWKYAEL